MARIKVCADCRQPLDCVSGTRVPGYEPDTPEDDEEAA